MSDNNSRAGRAEDPQVFRSEPRPGQAGRNAGSPQGASAQPESFSSLISGLLVDLQDLVRGEISLAKTELREDATSAGRGIGMIAAGAIVGLTAFFFLMLGVTYLLNKSLEMWQAAGIVGAVLALIALLVIMNGKSKLSASNLKPEQTIESLKEDQVWAKQQMNSVKK